MSFEKAINLIEEFEGWDEKPYKDSVGKWTIGIGFATWGGSPVTEMTKPITRQQGEDYLAKLLTALQAKIDNAVTAPLNENQNAALLSFCYNLGFYAFLGSAMFKMIQKMNYAGASEEFPKWCHAGGVELAGLKRRREAEKELFDAPV